MKFKSIINLIVISVTIGLIGCNSKVKEDTNTAPPMEEKDEYVKLISKEEERKVEVWFGEELFTAYIYPLEMEKPVLYPINAAGNIAITRGFPLDPRAGERVDHPHHVGNWFNYGDVNGLDFWNNSYDIPEEKKDEYGKIKHTSIVSSSNGERGELEIKADWLGPKGDIILKEETKFLFSENGNSRIIDRITTLTAQEQTVNFKDNKEGAFAIRMARELELPTDEELILTDAKGNPTEVAKMDNTGVTGDYLNSNGTTGGDVWAKRANWCKLFGQKDGKTINVVIMDHPNNPGYPTYWHSRKYGLFSANPFGQEIFSKGKEVLNFKLEAGEKTTFKYRIIINTDNELGKEVIDKVSSDFASVQ
ncbi:MAG: PmoA family protein [Flammeovirgaceae bacterium]|nr:PmoA family protein [Flammeovirgaceae bacterium]